MRKGTFFRSKEIKTHTPLRYSKVSWAIDGSDEQVHLVDDWPDPAAPNATREKIPSAVSYNNKGELSGWGYNLGKDTMKVKGFKRAVNMKNVNDLGPKLQLHRRDPPVHLQQSSFGVVSDYLRCIWNHTKVHISRHREEDWESLYSPSFILTVPRHWDSSCTQRMITIAWHAGLPLNISFISEPRATALALFNGMVPTQDMRSWESKDIIIVCDAGVHKVVSIVPTRGFSLLKLSRRTLPATKSLRYGHSNLKDICLEEVCKLLHLRSHAITDTKLLEELCGSTLIETWFESIFRAQLGPHQHDRSSPMLNLEILEQFEAMDKSFSGSNTDGLTVGFSNIKNSENQGIQGRDFHLKPYVYKFRFKPALFCSLDSSATLRTIFSKLCEGIIREVDDGIKEAISNQLEVKVCG